MNENISIFWFRRDLRLEDNTALFYALKNEENILPLFIFDKNILNELKDKKDRRVNFIYKTIQELKLSLENLGSSILVEYGKPLEVFKKIIEAYKIKTLYCNQDYEPYAKERDNQIQKFLNKNNISFHCFKDQVIFEKSEVVKNDGKPYTIFTPYSKKWKSQVDEKTFASHPSENYQNRFLKISPLSSISLEDMGFEKIDFDFPDKKVSQKIIQEYSQKRDYPAIKGTTRLSVHLRFGTLSVRSLANIAKDLSETWLNELIWRDFYMMILFHFPHVIKQSFKPAYDKIPWRNNEKEFKLWSEGKTGYPIVDAGMRELNNTGFMHNRVRMITASFLTKHLLIDWRWGEAYFAEKLLDYDLSANNGGWQWAASSGCDAVPYFRIFNPTSQTKKFDKDFAYIKKWVPEFNSFSYPKPIVEHKFARERALKVFKENV